MCKHKGQFEAAKILFNYKFLYCVTPEVFPWEYREFLLLRDVCLLGFKNQCLTNCSVTHSVAYIDISHSFNCLITSSMNDKKYNGRVSFFS